MSEKVSEAKAALAKALRDAKDERRRQAEVGALLRELAAAEANRPHRVAEIRSELEARGHKAPSKGSAKKAE